MDKKNTLIGVLLLVTAFAALFVGQRLSPPPVRAPEAARPLAAPGTAPAQPGTAAAPANPAATPAPAMPSDATFAAVAGDNASARLTLLGNDLIEATFTDFGGAILDVAFRKYPAELGRPEPFVFN